MKFEKTEVWGFEHAIRGMRNPLESWQKSDSEYIECINAENGKVHYELESIGKNDMELMQKLIKAGSEHRKFLRQIIVSVDITAPLYWWKEFDTYKVGTVANSTSTMHKLARTPINLGCFETDDFEDVEVESAKNINVGNITFWWSVLLEILESLRNKYNKTKDKKYWKELIRLLPESWLQTRTVTMSYENILNMYRHRKNHKLTEWSVAFCNWVESLPYAKELLMIGD